MMIKRLFLILLLFVSPFTLAANVKASIDKTEIVLNETINLTITSDGSDAPDLEPLKNLFDILGIQESREAVYVNGQTTSFRRWTINLKPITQAKGIVIPPINLGQDKTDPITIKLIDQPTNVVANGHDILKVETTLNKDSAYVQEQLVLTLRIYAADGQVYRLNNLIPPALDVNIKQLNNTQHEEQINGIHYSIIERSYAISPQKSGQLKIPSFALTALVKEDGRTQNKTVTSNELTIKIKPKPANYPKNAPWLPAKNITLTEHWDKMPNNVLQGDTLIRTLSITAEGLTSDQLGALPTTSIAGLRNYPEQPKLADDWQQDLPIGTREEKDLIIPIQVGEITLPEIKVAWWNTETDKLEYATITERKVQVASNPAFNSTTTTANNDTQLTTVIKKVTSPNLWIWQLLTGIFAITTIIGFALWIYARKQPAIIKPDTPVINPKTLLDDIKRACQEHDPQATRIALDNWVKQQPENLTELVARYAPLAEAVEDLNKALYSETSYTWQGDNLWQAVQNLPPKEEVATANNTIIPPLYPK